MNSLNIMLTPVMHLSEMIAAATRLTTTNTALFNVTVNKGNEIISTAYQAAHLSDAHREMYGTRLISNGNGQISHLQ
jgi:hypothetical protein